MKIVITEEQYNKLMEGYVNFPIDDDIALEVWEDKDKLELSSIVIPKHLRGEGKGTEIMNMVINYSDNVNKPIYLTPDTSFGGTSVNRLKRFYGGFGFKKNRDYEVSHSMVRYPNQGNNLMESEEECVSPRYVIKYIKEITPIKEDIPFHFLQMIKESNTRFCLKNINIEELLNSDNDLREYVENSDSRYEDDEVDINDMFQPIVVLNGECLDGYSRVKGHIDNGETHIEGYVG